MAAVLPCKHSMLLGCMCSHDVLSLYGRDLDPRVAAVERLPTPARDLPCLLAARQSGPCVQACTEDMVYRFPSTGAPPPCTHKPPHHHLRFPREPICQMG